MLAAALADVLPADLDPAVLGGVGDHPLDQGPVRLLGLGPAADLGACLGQSIGEGVADPLQLGDAEDPGATGGTDPPLDPAARERAREELGELALHAGDLYPQRPPGGPDVDTGDTGGAGRRKLGRRSSP